MRLICVSTFHYPTKTSVYQDKNMATTFKKIVIGTIQQDVSSDNRPMQDIFTGRGICINDQPVRVGLIARGGDNKVAFLLAGDFSAQTTGNKGITRPVLLEQINAQVQSRSPSHQSQPSGGNTHKWSDYLLNQFRSHNAQFQTMAYANKNKDVDKRLPSFQTLLEFSARHIYHMTLPRLMKETQLVAAIRNASARAEKSHTDDSAVTQLLDLKNKICKEHGLCLGQPCTATCAGTRYAEKPSLFFKSFS